MSSISNLGGRESLEIAVTCILQNLNRKKVLRAKILIQNVL